MFSSRTFRSGSRFAGRHRASQAASARRITSVASSSAARAAVQAVRRAGVSRPGKYGVGYGKKRRTYKRGVRVGSRLRMAIKKVENEDKEMKYTSVSRLYADIIANGAGSWTRIVAAQPILRDVTDTTVLAQSNTSMYGTAAYNAVVTGDSILLNREGAEIYSKRLDLFFDVVFDGSSNIKTPYAYVRVWVIQAKHLASSTTPTWQLWQGESKAGEIAHAWNDKPTQWFDPRSNTNSSQKNQFKVLKKMLIKVKNPYINAVNHVYGNTVQAANGIAVPAGTAANPTGGPYTTGAAITTSATYPSDAGAKQFFRSIYLGKNCLSTKYASDASGDPSMGQVYVLAQGWSPYLSTFENVTVSLYGRMCYKEDPGC